MTIVIEFGRHYRAKWLINRIKQSAKNVSVKYINFTTTLLRGISIKIRLRSGSVINVIRIYR